MSTLIDSAKVTLVKLLCDLYPESLESILSFGNDIQPKLDSDFTPNQLIEQGQGERVILFVIRELQSK